MRFDTVVIGGGISGMSAAILLARHGERVALVETSPRLAPVVRGFSRDGLYFDTGFHYAGGLGDGEILDLFFRHLGVAGGIVKEAYAPDGFDLYRDPVDGEDIPFCYGPERMQEQLQQRFPQEGEAIRSYFAALERECRRLPYLNLDAPFDPQVLLNGMQGPTLRQVLEGLTGDRALQRLLALHCLLYGSTPDEIPFMLHASVVAPYFSSTYGLQGGGRQLVAAFEARLAELGVEVMTGQAVRRIELDDAGQVAAVTTARGERLDCRRCVASVAPQVLLGLVPPGTFRPAYRKRLGGLSESASAHLLFAGCGDTVLLEGRNLFLDGRHDPFSGFTEVPLEERTLYLARARAEEGGDACGVVVICPADQTETSAWRDSRLGRRPESYRDFKVQILELLQRRVERECPELGGLTPVAGATPLTVRDYAGNPGGGLYGVKHRVGQYNPQPATRVPGLLLAGQAVAAPGILGATLSAYLCCGQILGHDTLRNEVKQCS